jgi:DNA polymerase-3 subunit alpha
MKGRAKQIMTLDQVRRKYAQHLSLTLKSDELQSGFCDHLANILSPYLNIPTKQTIPGQGEIKSLDIGCQVVINYQRPGSRGCIMLGQNWVVSPTNDLLQTLRMEYGKDQVNFGYKQTTSLN